MSDTEWERFYALITRRLTDGSKGWGHIMRRRIKGEWQYRKMTKEEEDELIMDTAV